MIKKTWRYVKMFSSLVIFLLRWFIRIFILVRHRESEEETPDYGITYRCKGHKSIKPIKKTYDVLIFFFFDSGVSKVQYVCECCERIIKFTYVPKRTYNTPSILSSFVLWIMWP